MISDIESMQTEDRNRNDDVKKIKEVAEVLAILDETHRRKDWLLEHIKKSHLKIPIKPSMNSFQILNLCPDEFVSNVLKVLKGDDLDEFEQISTLTKTYHWFFCDIVAGSNPSIPTKDQVKKVMVLNELISRAETFKNKDPKTTVILPTGDGMAIGYGDSAEKPLRLAIELHKSLNKYNESKRGKEKLLIRVGIDMGPVYFVKDVTGRDNVWGPGIILTRRVMDLAADMQILTSSRIAQDIRTLSPEYKSILHPIGDYSIKHGEQLNLYNIYGDGFGNKTAPRKSKVAKANLQKDIKTTNNFSFHEIEVKLDVKDPGTMLTHHTWVWDVINVAKEPKSQIFYYLDGDAPKEFADMNVKVTDDRGKELQILSVNVNKPYHKEFNVQLNRPLKPKQKKTFILEYDWEEPQRTFFYRMASNCKKFRYSFSIPKGIELKNRVLKVDPETGYKVHADPPPKTVFHDNLTEIAWQKENLKAYEAYQFDW